MIVKDRELLNEDGSIPIQLLVKCIENNETMKIRYERLEEYYKGKHDILNRTLSNEDLPNNKLVCNHAEYITDMAIGYVFGNPVNYEGEGSDKLEDVFTQIDEDSHNNELALDLSIYGIGYELLFMSNDETPYPELAVINPKNAFVVCDSTVKNIPMFAVSYYPKLDINDTLKGYDVNVYTDKEIIHYFFTDLGSTSPDEINREEHYFGGIPIIEYKNNKSFKGDFEGVITLINAYNVLQSDRVNDKEQLVDAFLAVSGMSMGDNEGEQINTIKELRKLKVLELDEGGKAEWLVKQLTEDQVEVLKKSLKDDIHEFSLVPCLTDENFVGNASGVAMKYKLLGLEQLAKTKERYFKQGLRKRIKMIFNVMRIQAKEVNVAQIDIIMKRNLPVDEELNARISQETSELLSQETRIKRYDSEIDVDEEMNRINKEKDQSMEREQKAFGSYDLKNGDDKDVDNTDDNINSDKFNKDDLNRRQAGKN